MYVCMMHGISIHASCCLHTNTLHMKPGVWCIYDNEHHARERGGSRQKRAGSASASSQQPQPRYALLRDYVQCVISASARARGAKSQEESEANRGRSIAHYGITQLRTWDARTDTPTSLLPGLSGLCDCEVSVCSLQFAIPAREFEFPGVYIFIGNEHLHGVSLCLIASLIADCTDCILLIARTLHCALWNKE
jgi:hypothetical protein